MPRSSGSADIAGSRKVEPHIPLTECFSAAWKDVMCAGCGKHYQCTPSQDYYHEPDVLEAGTQTLQNGYCMTCLCLRAKLHPDRVVNPDGSPA